MMIMLCVCTVKTGILRPPKPGLPAPNVTSRHTIHVRVSTAMTVTQSTSVLNACLEFCTHKGFSSSGFQLIALFYTNNILKRFNIWTGSSHREICRSPCATG